MVPVSTRIGRLNVMSQLHFDGDPGTVSFGVLQTPPVFCDQLVQLGRFNLPSPSVSTQLTLSTRTVTTLPFGGPHPLAVLISRHASPSRLAAKADPSVTTFGEAGSVWRSVISLTEHVPDLAPSWLGSPSVANQRPMS